MGQAFVYGGVIFLVTANTVQCLGIYQVKQAILGSGQERKYAGTIIEVATANSVIIEELNYFMTVSLSALPA